MKKIFNSRFLSIILLILAVCTVLSSCVGSAQPQTIEKNAAIVEDVDYAYSFSDLNLITTTIYNDKDARDAFLAACRGYDVINNQYDDFSDSGEINLTYVKAVIDKYVQVQPKEGKEISEHDVNAVLNGMQDKVELEANRDLLGTIRYWIGSFLGILTNTVGFGNYLVGICIFAIFVEILMLPFAIKQQKNSIKQANLRPKEMAIRNRYKGRNDQATQQKVAQEIQELYQRENFNPMSGCLPMLIQLPIIMLLYNIVVDPIQNVLGGSVGLSSALQTYATTSQAAGGLGLSLGSSNGTIEMLSYLKNADLSSLETFGLFSNSGDVFDAVSSLQGKFPSFNIGNINFGLNPSFNDNYWLLTVPVLTFVVYFASMKISKKFTYQPTQNENAPGAGCSTKMMDYYMPLVSTVFCFMVPGAVGIYWVFRSILTTFKQFIMSKVMPLPKFTEEDYREAERELNSKRPQRKRKNAEDLDPNRERPRSLHHIDDDDEEYPTFVD